MASILIIDDEEGIRNFLHELLSGAGYTVTTAMDGRVGTDLITSQAFDLVITDLVMPERDGFDILAAVQGQVAPCAVIAISGYSSDSPTYLRAARHLGARAVLSKPFTREQILGAIADSLAKSPADPGGARGGRSRDAR